MILDTTARVDLGLDATLRHRALVRLGRGLLHRSLKQGRSYRRHARFRSVDERSAAGPNFGNGDGLLVYRDAASCA